jgi:hypothetical protein
VFGTDRTLFVFGKVLLPVNQRGRNRSVPPQIPAGTTASRPSVASIVMNSNKQPSAAMDEPMAVKSAVE